MPETTRPTRQAHFRFARAPNKHARLQARLMGQVQLVAEPKPQAQRSSLPTTVFNVDSVAFVRGGVVINRGGTFMNLHTRRRHRSHHPMSRLDLDKGILTSDGLERGWG